MTTADLTGPERDALAWVAAAEPTGRARSTAGVHGRALAALRHRRFVWISPSMNYRSKARWRLTVEGQAAAADLAHDEPTP